MTSCREGITGQTFFGQFSLPYRVGALQVQKLHFRRTVLSKDARGLTLSQRSTARARCNAMRPESPLAIATLSPNCSSSLQYPDDWDRDYSRELTMPLRAVSLHPVYHPLSATKCRDY